MLRSLVESISINTNVKYTANVLLAQPMVLVALIQAPVPQRRNIMVRKYSSSFDHDDDDNDNDNDDDDDAAGCHPLVPIKALPKLFGTHLPDSLPFLLCPISCPVVPVGY
jgi:hypothetical protein